MAKFDGIKHINPTKLPLWKYISGTKVICDGTSQAVAVPSSATTFILSAEDGKVYFAINHTGFASATSPGLVAQDSQGVFGPFSNLETLDVYGVAGTFAHIIFLEEVAK